MRTLLCIAAIVLSTFRFVWHTGLLFSSQPALAQFTHQGSKQIVTRGHAGQDWSVALSGDRNGATVGEYGDNSTAEAAWVFAQPMLSSSRTIPTIQDVQIRTVTSAVNLGALQVNPSNNAVTLGPQGGPFLSSQFSHTFAAPNGDHQPAELPHPLAKVVGLEEANDEGRILTITVASPDDGAQYVNQGITITAVASAKAASIVLYGDANELKT